MTRPATTWGGEDGRSPLPGSGSATVASGRQRRVWVRPLFLRAALGARVQLLALSSAAAAANWAAAAPPRAHPARSRRLGAPQPTILKKSVLERPHSRGKVRVPPIERRATTSSSLWCFCMTSISASSVVRQALEGVRPQRPRFTWVWCGGVPSNCQTG